MDRKELHRFGGSSRKEENGIDPGFAASGGFEKWLLKL
jgi:hypothetical protein